MRSLLVLFGFLLLAGLALSASSLDLNGVIGTAFSEDGSLKAAFQPSLYKLNKYGEQVPSLVKDFFGNERVNLYVLMNDGSVESFGVVMKEARIQSLTRSKLADPTLNVNVSEQAILNVLSASDTEQAFVQAIKGKHIQYEGVGFFNSLKFAFIDFFSGFWLSMMGYQE